MKPSFPSEFFVCVASFENTGKPSDFIPENCWGASGLVAIDAETEDGVIEVLRAGFEYLELKLIDINKIRKINSPNEILDIDEHLFENIHNWEPNHRWVIGTVHGYYGEGEA